MAETLPFRTCVRQFERLKDHGNEVVPHGVTQRSKDCVTKQKDEKLPFLRELNISMQIEGPKVLTSL